MKTADKKKGHGLYTLMGLLGGLCNGLFGAGGGLVLLPLLTRWANVQGHRAFATCLGIMVPLSCVSAIVYFFSGHIDFFTAWPYLLGGLFGGLLAGKLFLKVPLLWLRRIFALFILYAGIKAVVGF